MSPCPMTKTTLVSTILHVYTKQGQHTIHKSARGQFILSSLWQKQSSSGVSVYIPSKAKHNAKNPSGVQKHNARKLAQTWIVSINASAGRRMPVRTAPMTIDAIAGTTGKERRKKKQICFCPNSQFNGKLCLRPPVRPRLTGRSKLNG